MSKDRPNFVCQDCGARALRWLGRCPNCGAWHTLVEERAGPAVPDRTLPAPEAPALSAIAQCGDGARLATGIPEFDRVLGGGFVPDSVVLLAGDPGVGKSTLLLQIADRVPGDILYVSGEESAAQLKLRASRLGIGGERVRVLGDPDVDAVLGACLRHKPALVIVDSAQTLRTADMAGSPGTVGQVRESVARLAAQAKSLPYALCVVSHVTKDGLVAGPKVVEHLVDVVLRLEGDNQYDFRLLRAVKNRFGPTGELGVFEMAARGLAPVERSERLFCPGDRPPAPGAATVVTCEGTRCFLVEVQALVTPSPWQIPNRRVTGLDPNRVALYLALLGKLGAGLGQRDVFVNVAGGFRLSETAADLGTVMAVASSHFETPLPPQVAFIGEVGLRGELRAVHNFQARVREAAHCGVTRVIAPRGNAYPDAPIRLDAFSELREVLAHFCGDLVKHRGVT
ncbi:MAG TPA: DNA repair protein RadA [Planctomycetes bacterium]|nr:DNA repair protein RadA [Planctomycetota bacterium]